MARESIFQKYGVSQSHNITLQPLGAAHPAIEHTVNGPFKAGTVNAAAFSVQRRNRPNLAIGDLVYARVTVASRDMEPELACTDASGKVAALNPKYAAHLHLILCSMEPELACTDASGKVAAKLLYLLQPRQGSGAWTVHGCQCTV